MLSPCLVLTARGFIPVSSRSVWTGLNHSVTREFFVYFLNEALSFLVLLKLFLFSWCQNVQNDWSEEFPWGVYCFSNYMLEKNHHVVISNVTSWWPPCLAVSLLKPRHSRLVWDDPSLVSFLLKDGVGCRFWTLALQLYSISCTPQGMMGKASPDQTSDLAQKYDFI